MLDLTFNNGYFDKLCFRVRDYWEIGARVSVAHAAIYALGVLSLECNPTIGIDKGTNLFNAVNHFDLGLLVNPFLVRGMPVANGHLRVALRNVETLFRVIASPKSRIPTCLDICIP